MKSFYKSFYSVGKINNKKLYGRKKKMNAKMAASAFNRKANCHQYNTDGMKKGVAFWPDRCQFV